MRIIGTIAKQFKIIKKNRIYINVISNMNIKMYNFNLWIKCNNTKTRLALSSLDRITGKTISESRERARVCWVKGEEILVKGVFEIVDDMSIKDEDKTVVTGREGEIGVLDTVVGWEILIKEDEDELEVDVWMSKEWDEDTSETEEWWIMFDVVMDRISTGCNRDKLLLLTCQSSVSDFLSLSVGQVSRNVNRRILSEILQLVWGG